MPHTMFRHHNFNKISKFWQNFKILTGFHNFDRNSKLWQDFKTLTGFTNFDRVLQFWQDFAILTGFCNHYWMHSFDWISQCWSNFTILVKFHYFDRIFCQVWILSRAGSNFAIGMAETCLKLNFHIWCKLDWKEMYFRQSVHKIIILMQSKCPLILSSLRLRRSTRCTWIIW